MDTKKLLIIAFVLFLIIILLLRPKLIDTNSKDNFPKSTVINANSEDYNLTEEEKNNLVERLKSLGYI